MGNYRMAGYGGEFNEELLLATHPAPVGTFIVYAKKDGSAGHKVAVVLWGVLQDGSPVPITMSGVWDGVEQANVCVQHPDGSCSNFDNAWPSLEVALAELSAFAEH